MKGWLKGRPARDVASRIVRRGEVSQLENPELRCEDVFGDLPVLRTERLILRKATEQDAGDLFEAASDPEVARYTSWEPHASPEVSRAVIGRWLLRYREGQAAPWAMEVVAEGTFIGTCGFLSWSIAQARAEIGYAISRRYWNQGLVTEAVREVLRFGFEVMQLNRIQATCEPANTASGRVLEKVGMSYEGTLREYAFDKGAFHDLRMYAVLRQEWFRSYSWSDA